MLWDRVQWIVLCDNLELLKSWRVQMVDMVVSMLVSFRKEQGGICAIQAPLGTNDIRCGWRWSVRCWRLRGWADTSRSVTWSFAGIIPWQTTHADWPTHLYTAGLACMPRPRDDQIQLLPKKGRGQSTVLGEVLLPGQQANNACAVGFYQGPPVEGDWGRDWLWREMNFVTSAELYEDGPQHCDYL